VKERLHPRVPVSTEIRVWDDFADEPLGRLGNLSYGGLLLIADRRLPLDAVYQIRIEVPDASRAVEPLSLGVETLWSQGPDGGRPCWVGMRIIDMSETDKGRLRELMELQRP
jgi:hypothetical protein